MRKIITTINYFFLLLDMSAVQILLESHIEIQFLYSALPKVCSSVLIKANLYHGFNILILNTEEINSNVNQCPILLNIYPV